MDKYYKITQDISQRCDEETLKHFLFANVYNTPDKKAFEWRNEENSNIESITYTQLAEQIITIGTALYHKDLRGKTIAIAGRTGISWLLLFVTALCSNITVVPLDFSLPSDEIKKRADHCNVTLLLKDKDICTDLVNDNSVHFAISDIQDIAQLIEEGQKLLENYDCNDWTGDYLSQKQIGMMLFTSGTGGKMKAAMLRQENLTLERFVWQGLEANKDKCLVLLPLYHVAGIKDLYGSMMTGATTYLSAGIKYLLDEFDYVKPKSCFIVPAQANMLNVLLNGKSKSEGRSLLGNNIAAFRTSAAPLPENLRSALDYYDIKVTSDYGMTETGGPVSVSVLRNGEFYSKPSSVGHILDQINVRIDQPDANGYGEVIVSGQCVFEGYFNDDKETRRIIKDGDLYTGDIGHIDQDNFLYIVGRKKNVIIRTDGINVIPEEIEKNILTIPGIDECMVYQDKNQIIAKVYSIKGDAESYRFIESEINRINRTQPYYKRIDNIIFIKEPLPKTGTGKIKRGVQ